jgi:hypothetical protein
MDESITLWNILATLIGLVGGAAGLVSLLKLKPEKRKLEAEAAQVITNAAKQVVEQYQDELRSVKARVARLERRLRAWIVVAEARAEQLREARITPCPDPEDEDEEGV